MTGVVVGLIGEYLASQARQKGKVLETAILNALEAFLSQYSQENCPPEYLNLWKILVGHTGEYSTKEERKIIREAIAKYQRELKEVSREVKERIKQLRHPNESIRINAASALGRMGQVAQEAVPTLVNVLDSVHEEGRQTIISTLESIGPPASSAAPALVTALNSKHRVVREATASVLERMGKTAVPALTKALGQTGRSYATQILKNMGTSAVPGLVDGLGSRDKLISDHAFDTLIEIGGPAIPFLITALRRDGVWVGNVLAAIGKNAVPELIKALDDENKNVRASAIYTLEQIAPRVDPDWILARDAVPKLIRILNRIDENNDIRSAAVSALTKIATPAAISGLAETLKNDDQDTRRWAISGLRRIGTPEALDVLKDFGEG